MKLWLRCRRVKILYQASQDTTCKGYTYMAEDNLPRTLPWSEPYRIRRKPPALVETFPPIWQLPLAPKSSGIICLKKESLMLLWQASATTSHENWVLSQQITKHWITLPPKWLRRLIPNMGFPNIISGLISG